MNKTVLIFYGCRSNEDDEDDFMDDPAFDDADNENKENAVELGKNNTRTCSDIFTLSK